MCMSHPFSIGVNSGRLAGQSVLHAHVHLIPRRAGDVANPRGGVCSSIPGKELFRKIPPNSVHRSAAREACRQRILRERMAPLNTPPTQKDCGLHSINRIGTH